MTCPNCSGTGLFLAPYRVFVSLLLEIFVLVQALQQRRVAPALSPSRAFPYLGLGIDVCLVLQQKLHQLDVPVMTGHVEWSVTHLESNRGERVTGRASGDNTSHSELDEKETRTVTAVKGRMDEEALARLAAAPWGQLSRPSEARGLGGARGSASGKRSVR